MKTAVIGKPQFFYARCCSPQNRNGRGVIAEKTQRDLCLSAVKRYLNKKRLISYEPLFVYGN